MLMDGEVDGWTCEEMSGWMNRGNDGWTNVWMGTSVLGRPDMVPKSTDLAVGHPGVQSPICHGFLCYLG